MKRLCFVWILVAGLGAGTPGRAQAPLNAPVGWSTQERAGGAHTFTPPDLKAGELYNITVYDSAPMEGQTLVEYLTKFAGPVGKAAGQLAEPLKTQQPDARVISATGVYIGPQGQQLGAIFMGMSLDGGANIHMARTLTSLQDGLLERYQPASQTLLAAMADRARAEAGDNTHSTPSEVAQKLKTVGGKLEPGVYAGVQYRDAELERRYRVYIFADGQYLLCDQNDQNITKRFFDEMSGAIGYNRVTGQLNLDWTMGLGTYSDGTWCYYGRDASGKPTIYAEADHGFNTSRVTLTWVEAPTKRLSPTQKAAADAAAAAERKRYKWVVPAGKGVATASIQAVLLESRFNGQYSDETVYLLLKDGSVYADLPVPADELDVVRSKQNEADKWGKWRAVGKGYSVSWAGGAYQPLPGMVVQPAQAQQKLSGRWGTGSSSGVLGMSSSYALWGVTFTSAGRFRKDSRGGYSSTVGFGDQATHVNSGYDDEGSYGGGTGPGYAVASSTKKQNPNGAREGDYTLNGYVLTLRYDNGKVARLPFFFLDSAYKGLWFEGNSMSRD